MSRIGDPEDTAVMDSSGWRFKTAREKRRGNAATTGAPADNQTRFQRNDAARANFKRSLQTSAAPKTAGGNKLTPELIALRALAVADQKNPGSARLERLKALVMEYLTTTPAGKALLTHDRVIEANIQSLVNGLLYAESEGYPLSLALLSQVHVSAAQQHYLFENRHVGPDGSLLLRPGEEAPHIFEWRTPQEEVAANNQVFESEAADARKLSDAELRAKVLAERKYPSAGQPGHGGQL